MKIITNCFDCDNGPCYMNCGPPTLTNKPLAMTPTDLRTRRVALGLSQWEAATALGISERQYQYLEAGKRGSKRAVTEIPTVYALAWREVERQRQGA